MRCDILVGPAALGSAIGPDGRTGPAGQGHRGGRAADGLRRGERAGDPAPAVALLLVLVQFVTGPALLVCGLCLVQRWPWAARIAMIVCALNIAFGVGTLFAFVVQGLVTLALNGVLVWLLSTEDVRHWLSLPRNP